MHRGHGDAARVYGDARPAVVLRSRIDCREARRTGAAISLARPLTNRSVESSDGSAGALFPNSSERNGSSSCLRDETTLARGPHPTRRPLGRWVGESRHVGRARTDEGSTSKAQGAAVLVGHEGYQPLTGREQRGLWRAATLSTKVGHGGKPLWSILFGGPSRVRVSPSRARMG